MKSHCGMIKTKNFRYSSEKPKHANVQAESINGLKNVYCLQLALHLPESSEIRCQIFDKLDTGDLKGEAGLTAVIELLKQHENDDNITAFETWGEFKNFCCKDGQTVGDYVMCHEKCKVKMRQFKMDFREHLHGLNLLCGTKAMFTSYRMGFCSFSQNYLV